jgi:hypothetical protein
LKKTRRRLDGAFFQADGGSLPASVCLHGISKPGLLFGAVRV